MLTWRVVQSSHLISVCKGRSSTGTDRRWAVTQQILSTLGPHPRRSRSYILNLLPRCIIATLPNPSTSPPEPEAVAWVLTHLDGSLGMLYTSPLHRRKGLGRQVVQEHLARFAEKDSRAFAYVSTENEASEALWRGLGWESWEVGWWIVR